MGTHETKEIFAYTFIVATNIPWRPGQKQEPKLQRTNLSWMVANAVKKKVNMSVKKRLDIPIYFVIAFSSDSE